MNLSGTTPTVIDQAPPERMEQGWLKRFQPISWTKGRATVIVRRKPSVRSKSEDRSRTEVFDARYIGIHGIGRPLHAGQRRSGRLTIGRNSVADQADHLCCQDLLRGSYPL